MKKNPSLIFLTSFILSLLFSCFVGYSQPKKAEEIKEFVWGNHDTYKEIPDVPEKWSNESAVIIFNNDSHFYNKTAKSLDNFFLTRRIIKLNDKASVERFSEFNYPTLLLEGIKEIKTWLGIKIIKPNGEIKIVDVENEKVKTSKDAKMYVYGFIGVKTKSDQVYKLAVPELEVGDIIDYYIYTYEEYKTSGNYVMNPVETTLSGEYPTMDFLLKLKVENDFFINFNSYNGAPELEDITKEKQRDKEYRLVAKDIDKYESKKWVYPVVEYPSYKYQISFAKSAKHENRAYAFLSEKEDIIKKQVSKNDIFDEYERYFYFTSYDKQIKKYLKEKDLSTRALVEEAYYYMRHLYFNRYTEAVVATQKKFGNLYYLGLYKYPTLVTEPYDFILRFGSWLKTQDIPFDLIAAKNRYDGPIEDLLIRENLRWIMKVHLPDESLYITPFGPHTFVNSVPSTLEGTDAYKVSMNSTYTKLDKIEEYTLPVSKYTVNNTKEISEIKIDDEFSTIDVKRTSYLTGHAKSNQISEKLFYFEYLPEEFKRFNTSSVSDLLSKKNKPKYEKAFNAYKEKLIKDREERLKADIEKELETTVEEYDYQVLQTGRETFDDTLSFQQNFSIKNDFIKRAGPNYIIEVGKFIGGQVAIKEEEKTRTEHIHMPYSRSFNNEMNITIPDGYEVSGLDKLRLNVENETGGFKSEANVEGNILKIKTLKYYVNNYEPNSNWSKMLEFLEIAYQFSQKKILLKKN